jgi:hypothetical protein
MRLKDKVATVTGAASGIGRRLNFRKEASSLSSSIGLTDKRRETHGELEASGCWRTLDADVDALGKQLRLGDDEGQQNDDQAGLAAMQCDSSRLTSSYSGRREGIDHHCRCCS